MNEGDTFLLYRKSISRRARGYMNHHAILRDASVQQDDIEQELALAWLKAIRTWDSVKSHLTTHFDNVARNYMIDYVRCSVTGKGHNKRTASDGEFMTVPLAEANTVPAEDLIGNYETTAAIKHAVEGTLTPRDASIVMMYFGIGSEDGAGLTEHELADEFGVSQQRINAIIKRAMTNVSLVAALQESFGA